MYLAILTESRYKVYAYLETRVGDDEMEVHRCPFHEDVEALGASNPRYQGDAFRLHEIMVRYAETGTSRMSSEQFKSVTSPTNDIFEFKRGRLRAYCFKDDDNKLVIVTCCVLKKDEPDKKKVRHARGVKDQYFADKAEGNIRVV